MLNIKNILLFIFVIFLLKNSYAQIFPFSPSSKNVSYVSTIDSGNIRIYYALNALNIDIPKTYDDLQCLEIGTYLSKYYSYFVYKSDSLVTDWINKHQKAQSVPIRMGNSGKNPDRWSEYYFSEFFKNFTENTFTEYARMPLYLSNSNCFYTEFISSQQWKIEDDTLTIIGYLCQKAICNFSGRNFIAWFSTDIPINNGPWKFGGLPGLILKVYDKDKLYVFECVGIKNNKDKYPINRYNDYKNYRKIERGKLLKFQKEIHENYMKVANLVPGKNSKNNYKLEKISYDPLELE